MLIRSAEELEGYSRGEEDRIEDIIRKLAGALRRAVLRCAVLALAFHFGCVS